MVVGLLGSKGLGKIVLVLICVPCRWKIMPASESMREVFVLKNPPTSVVRSVSNISRRNLEIIVEVERWKHYGQTIEVKSFARYKKAN